jgi:hypothetical protein
MPVLLHMSQQLLLLLLLPSLAKAKQQGMQARLAAAAVQQL